MARRGRQQFQFTRLEMAALGLSFTLTAALVFVLGVAVGRQNVAGHHGTIEEAARIPIDDTSRFQAPAAAPAGAAPEGKAAAASAPAKAAAPPQAKPVQSPQAPALTGKPVYAVQVLATRRKQDADAMARSLTSSGFEAYVARIEDAEGSWYRVRVGRYDSVAEAKTMADRCRKELGLDQAYVSTY
jgi:cell division septation protein DedD